MKGKHLVLAGCVALVLGAVAQPAFAVPGLINFQGKLTDNEGTPLNGNYNMSFYLYEETGGTEVWTETQSVAVEDGIYSVRLGASTPLDAGLFAADELYLEVVIGGETLSPRQRLTTVAYAMRASDADMLEGYAAADLDQSAHLSDTGNPHGVTAAQAGALAAADYSWNTLPDVPAGFSDGTDDGITAETDPTITDPSVKDGVSWDELAGVPAGFADGIDNDTNTTYSAGTGLDLIGTQFNLEVPLNLLGSSPDYLLNVQNSGSGDGIRVSGGGWDGVYVSNVADNGVYISNPGDHGVHSYSAGEHGFYAFASAYDGLNANSPDDDGVEVSGPADNGLEIDAPGDSGVQVYSPTYDGLYVSGAGDDGVQLADCGYGVYITGAEGFGVYASSEGYGAYFNDTGSNTYAYIADGSYGIYSNGTKNFVQEHPTNPDQVIVYATLEGGEAGTYYRGTARLTDGAATVALPEHFRLVTEEEGLTVQVTPREDCKGLYVAELTTTSIVVRELQAGTSDARFDFFINGIRTGYTNYRVINSRSELGLDRAEAKARQEQEREAERKAEREFEREQRRDAGQHRVREIDTPSRQENGQG